MSSFVQLKGASGKENSEGEPAIDDKHVDRRIELVPAYNYFHAMAITDKVYSFAAP